MPGYYWILLFLILLLFIYWKRQASRRPPKIIGPDGQRYHRREEYTDYYSGRKIWLLTRFDLTGQHLPPIISVFFTDTGEKCFFTVYKRHSGGYIQFKDATLSMVKIPPELGADGLPK